MFLGFLFLDPFVLLAVGGNFEGETADEEECTEDVRYADCGWQGGEEGCRESVNCKDRQELRKIDIRGVLISARKVGRVEKGSFAYTKGDPSCLSAQGAEECRW